MYLNNICAKQKKGEDNFVNEYFKKGLKGHVLLKTMLYDLSIPIISFFYPKNILTVHFIFISFFNLVIHPPDNYYK